MKNHDLAENKYSRLPSHILAEAIINSSEETQQEIAENVQSLL